MLRLALGEGWVELAGDGSVRSVTHPDGRPVLLQERTDGVEAQMHTDSRRWGKGFVIVDGRGYRFDAPTTLGWRDDGVVADYEWGALTLRVERRVAESWSETYELHNRSERPMALGTFAVSTPWRDVYESSQDSLTRAVHAHVWTGGADSWIWAVPMDGSAPGLGLRLTEGELWAYSVESRDQFTGSNVRGHLYLHITDHDRAPHAFGGQPSLTLEPGGTHRLSWSLAWHATLDAFHRARCPVVAVPDVATTVGGRIELQLGDGAAVAGPAPLNTQTPGLHHVDIGHRDGRRSRIAYLVSPPVREIAERRAAFLLERQRPVERGDSRRFAFVPYDNDAQLTVLGDTWTDWSDGRERVGSALLLQELLRLGWGDTAQLRDAVQGYHRFVLDHVVASDGTVLDYRADHTSVRLYNFPWFARFLLDAGDVDHAHRVMARFYQLGGRHFLAFELGGVITDLAAALTAVGRQSEAGELTTALLQQADTYLSYGSELPRHEVNYEQSIVAPLLDLLLAAHRLDPGRVPADELRRRLRWLTAFAADQPDARLRHMPIRHWDGYWFGRLRLWGDVFPHYWSVLNAAAFLSWPDGLLPVADTARLRHRANAILRGNLIAFAADGSASCAFIYPSCVNGQPAHRADPLANDQDWALVYALRHGLE